MHLIKLSSQFLNTIQLGLSTFMLFTADFTIFGLQKLINVSIRQDNVDYNVDGYVSQGLIYLCYGIFLIIAPSFISWLGPRLAIVIGSTMMTIFFFLFYFENTWLTYLGDLLSGLGCSLLVVGEGNYIVLNSDSTTISFHTSLFWAMFSSSMIPGYVYSAISFSGKSRIDRATRNQLIFVATGFGVIAILIVVFLQRPKGKVSLPPVKDSPLAALKRTVSLYISREFVTLTPTLVFMGVQQSFGWGVFISTIVFTQGFGTFATQLAPISAAVYGFGDVMGAAVFTISPKLRNFWTRRYVFWTGYVLQCLGFVGMFINIPDQAVFGYTNDSPFIGTPMAWLAILCSFVIGVSDGFYNPQMYSLLANMHPEHAAQTSALFRFSTSLSAAALYFASTVVSLHIQLIVITILGFMGSICFSVVDKRVYKMSSERESGAVS